MNEGLLNWIEMMINQKEEDDWAVCSGAFLVACGLTPAIRRMLKESEPFED